CVDALCLAALQMADEVPAERVAVRGVLGLEILGSVLAHDVDPSLGPDRHLLWGPVLRGRDDGYVRADLDPYPLVALPDLVRRQLRSRPDGRGCRDHGGARRRAPGCSTSRGPCAPRHRRPPW